jgi:hypothetical protein
LAKLSVIDIFTMLLGVAVLLIFIGGPDESLSTDGVLYSMKAVVIPRAGFYCIIIAQRMSRVSSRFFLEYHERVIDSASRDYDRKKLLETQPDEDDSAIVTGNPNEPAQHDISVPHRLKHGDEETRSLVQQDHQSGTPMNVEHREEERSVSSSGDSDRFENEIMPAARESQTGTGHFLTGHYLEMMDESDSDDDDEEESASSRSKEFRWGTMGVYFGGVSVLIVFIIGCIFAPAISLDASSLAGLAVESGKTYEEAVSEYGVFLVVSGFLVNARFIFNTKFDYIGFGFLLFAGVTSIGMVFILQAYQFVKRKLKERQLGPKLPSFGHKGCGLPSYFRLYKWNHMEIYLISVAIGVWQLGSIISYAIHFYCDILRRTYLVMSYIGLVEETSAQCYRIQATLPGNLVIMAGSFVILLLAFVFQATAQYRKNIGESLRWIDVKDVPRLSLAWSRDKSKNSRYSHLLLSSTFSLDEDSDEPPTPGTPNTMATTPPGTPYSRSGEVDDTPTTRAPSTFALVTPPRPPSSLTFVIPGNSCIALESSRVPTSGSSLDCVPRRPSSVRFDMTTRPNSHGSLPPAPPSPDRFEDEMPSTPRAGYIGVPTNIDYSAIRTRKVDSMMT